MILFKINFQCITVFPFKGDAPWAVDMNTITLGHSLKTVKIESWYVQICQRFRLIQSIYTSREP